MEVMVIDSVREVLNRCLAGEELSENDAEKLCAAPSSDVAAIAAAANDLRAQQVGDDVSYVVNRNINFTNVCIKHCTFCAFSRDHRQEEGYFFRPKRSSVERAKRGTSARPRCASRPDFPQARRVVLRRARSHAREGATGAPSACLLAGRDPLRCDASERLDSDYLPLSRRPDTTRSPAPPPRSSTTRFAMSSPRVESPPPSGSKSSTPRTSSGFRTTSTIMYGHVETYGALDQTHGAPPRTSRSAPEASPSSFRSRSSTKKHPCT